MVSVPFTPPGRSTTQPVTIPKIPAAGPAQKAYQPAPAKTAPRVATSTATSTSGVPNDAHSIINQFLSDYGLEGLGQWAWTQYTNAGGGQLGMDVVNAELPQQEAFKTRFPAISARLRAGLPSITPTDYINYENGLRQAFIQNGIALPIGGQDFTNIVSGLLTKDVSLNEVVNDRIGKALSGYSEAPDLVKQAFDQVYGVHGASALVSKILDPNLTDPHVQQLAQAANLLGTGRRFGIDMGVTGAEALAQLDQGQSGNGAQQFNKLAQISPLFNANVGENPNLTAGNQGVGFEFGTDAQAATEVQRRLNERQAAFAGSGGAAVTSSGVIGLGATPQT